MRKIAIVIFFLLLFEPILCVNSLAVGSDNQAFTLYEPSTDSFHFFNNLNKRLPMASTTKIMTAILAIELGNQNETITVCKEAVGIEGSSLYLAEGDTVNFTDLLYGLMLSSANDAATLIAITVGGSVNDFCSLMNEKARSLNLTNTNFTNPHGLPHDEHYTSCADLARLTAYALNNPLFKKIVSTKQKKIYISEKSRLLINHNKLLSKFEGCYGVKTGFTKKSGRCLVSAAEKNGVDLIAVTLNVSDDWSFHTALYEKGFSIFEFISLESLISQSYGIPILTEDLAFAKAVPTNHKDGYVVLKNNNTLTSKIICKKYICVDTKIGTKIGEIQIYYNNNLIDTIDLITTENIKIKNRRLK